MAVEEINGSGGILGGRRIRIVVRDDQDSVTRGRLIAQEFAEDTDMVAVINPPQAAILGVGGIQEKPVVKEGKVDAGKILSLTLSSDHRVIDGSEAAQFLKTLKSLLENPAILLVN